jgi:hypothetical protein
VFHCALDEWLVARQKTIVRVKDGKYRQGKSPTALDAAATTNPDPVVILLIPLLATAPAAADRIAVTNRSLAKDNPFAVFGPVGGKFALRAGDGDKEDRHLKRAS